MSQDNRASVPEWEIRSRLPSALTRPRLWMSRLGGTSSDHLIGQSPQARPRAPEGRRGGEARAGPAPVPAPPSGRIGQNAWRRPYSRAPGARCPQSSTPPWQHWSVLRGPTGGQAGHEATRKAWAEGQERTLRRGAGRCRGDGRAGQGRAAGRARRRR